jgi:predicted small secreted protein
MRRTGMRRRLAVTLLLAAALPLAACAGGGGGSGTDSRPSGDAPAAQTVQLQRFGGIGGNQDKVTVQPDGRWERTGKAAAGRTGTLAADQRDRLTRMAADPALAAEARRTVPESDCSDAFDYALTIGSTRVAWRDCGSATKPPATADGIAQFLLDNTK